MPKLFENIKCNEKVWPSLIIGIAAFLAPCHASDAEPEVYINLNADTLRFGKRIGQVDTIRGWLSSGKSESGLIVIDEKTHAQIAIDPFVCPKGGEVIKKYIWTGWMSYRIEYPKGGMPSKQMYKRLCEKLEALRKTYGIWDATPHVRVTGTVCHLKAIDAGIKNHRNCDLPRDYFFFCADSVRISDIKR